MPTTSFLLQKVNITLYMLVLFSIFACEKEEQHYVPKPKGYNRISLPAHVFQKLTESHPYTFEFSKWAKVLPDTFSIAQKDWLFIQYPQFAANIQLTYKPLGKDQNKLKEYINDSYKLAGKHQIRASSIQESKILTRSGRTVTLFKIEGDVPSPYQFYTTDSTDHFLRGAIYFPVATKNDSLRPVIDYIQKDMLQLLNTLYWR